MITLVGVGHVMDISAQVDRVISERHPDAVCIELDKARYRALASNVKGSGAPIAYRMLASFQQDLARRYGTQLGGEMLAAIDAAKRHQARVFGIDMDSRTMWNRMWMKLTLWQRSKIMLSALAGIFTPKRMIEEELESFQDDSEAYLELIQEEFPAIKQVLIDERNRHMSANIIRIMERYPRVVAFVGDAHVPGMSKELAGQSPEVIRLRQLLEMKADTNAEVSVKYGAPDER